MSDLSYTLKLIVDKIRFSLLCVIAIGAIMPFAVIGQTLEIGIEKFRHQSYQNALTVLEKLSNEGSAEYYYYLGLTRLMTGQTKDSISTLKVAVQRDGSNADYHFALAGAYLMYLNEINLFKKMGVFKKYKSSLLESMNISPGHLSANLNYAFYLAEAPSFLTRKDISVDEQIKKLRQLNPAYGNYIDGYMAEIGGQLEIADGYYAEALVKDPNFSRAIYALASLRFSSKKYDSAIELALLYSSSIPLLWDDPHKCEGDWLLGRIYTEMGEEEKGREHYEAAAKLCDNPSSVERIYEEMDEG